ncbi:MAG: ADP-ribosylglycohydrolase family protein [Oscillospiraceae bacterium]|jgi:ADP-ribosylglycohydrolase|nr:ADP-ribosylglycohydrolase family protein [Oscillospiraceae bacterium]
MAQPLKTSTEIAQGGLAGFAIGDALGHPIRDMTFEDICARFEKGGCLDLAVSRKTNLALFTDATQMTLFTAEGLIWADREANGREINYTAYVFYAYQLWLYTQTRELAGDEYAWLLKDNPKNLNPRLLRAKGLYRPRNTNDINIKALQAAREMGYGRLSKRYNDNDDNGALKRILPAGIYFNFDTPTAFRAGADFASITHGGYGATLAAGCYAAAVAELAKGATVDSAVKRAIKLLQKYENHEPVSDKLLDAINLLADRTVKPRAAVEMLGEGHTAAEALAIAFFCALNHSQSYENAVLLAANHGGASEVTAALTGGLLGTAYGINAIPSRWYKKLQYKPLIDDLGADLGECTVIEYD